MSDQSDGQTREEQPTRSFNPNEHVMQIKSSQGSRDYLPVQWRLVWFRDQCPDGTIETEMLHLDLERDTEEEIFVWNSEKRRSEKVIKQAKGFVIFKATVKNGKGGIATGTKSEKAASFPDYIEKAETGAIGRALAALGYGTQFAPELDEQHRIVDSPVERNTPSRSGNSTLVSVHSNGASNHGNATNGNGSQVAPTEDNGDAVATEQQLSSIRKLYERLGKAEPEQVASISYLGAKKLIQQLTAEYRESKQKAS